jgi:hypothetical protein
MSNAARAEVKSGLPWALVGTGFLLLLIVFTWSSSRGAGTTEALARKAGRIDSVSRMQVALTAAAEAEKSAVLATTDEESERFAAQARAATAELERERQELERDLAAGGSQTEKELFARFNEAFVALRRIDEEVLRLAVKNTNLKAYALAFGPEAEALAEFDRALAHLADERASGAVGARVRALADEARIGLLRVQVLLAPHIAEESDAKMDELEARMSREEGQAARDLEALAATSGLQADADLAAASAALARYRELKTRILALSRENSNVRSLSLSLNQKRKAMGICGDALASLRQAILEEPIAGVAYGRAAHPR